jgi:hypothetical protein
MHDTSPGGIALAERTLAFWQDLSNFPQYKTAIERDFEAIIAQLER